MGALVSTIFSFCALAVTESFSRGTTATSEKSAPSGFQHFVQPQTWSYATLAPRLTVTGELEHLQVSVPPANPELPGLTPRSTAGWIEMAMCLSSQELLASKRHDGANRLAPVHEIERVVDLLERHHVGNEVVDVDLLVHIPVDDLRHVRAAPRTAECGALPHATGHELERPRLDLLSRPRDADDHGHTPAAVTALECLTHEIDTANALEAVVRATVSERDQMLYQIPAHFLGIDEVRHAEALGERLAPRVEVDADDLVRANQARSLNDVEA